jgi:hypothetical protein
MEAIPREQLNATAFVSRRGPTNGRLVELAIGAILVVSAWLALQNRMVYYFHVAEYKLFPVFLARFIAHALPWLMLFCGTMMVARCARRAASAVSCLIFGFLLVSQLFAAWSGNSDATALYWPVFQSSVSVLTILFSSCLLIGCLFLALSSDTIHSDPK